MNILAMDTSTPLASIAVARNGLILAESLFGTDRTLSARLLPEIERLLRMAGLTLNDIDLFGCGMGPGSFTGVRAGIATVQGLALATGKPCAGFSSLAMLAMNAFGAAVPVCSLLDARKNEVYAGLYDCSSPLPTQVRPDCVIAPQLLAERLSDHTDAPVLFVGDGALRYREVLVAAMGAKARFAPLSAMAGRAANGIMLASQAVATGGETSPAGLVPNYLRPSEAELNRRAAFNT